MCCRAEHEPSVSMHTATAATPPAGRFGCTRQNGLNVAGPPMARLATTGITHFSSSNCLGSCMPDAIPVVVWPGPIRPITSVAAHLPAPSFAWWTTVSVRNARRSLKYYLIRQDRYQQLIWGSTPLVMTRVRQVPGCRRSRTGETLVRRRSLRAHPSV